MSIDEIVTELLLRWVDNPSLTPEEVSQEHQDNPQYADLLERLKQKICDYKMGEPFYQTTKEQERSPQATLPYSPPEAQLELPPGYDYVKKLDEGGMGVVCLAHQHSLKRQVALKMIKAGALASGEQITRFRNEAQAVAKLKHPNIVQIYEIGEHKGQPYFSMEFVEGGSLAKKLGGSPLPPAKAAQLMETLARAMQHAHDQRIVHRDLKPGNVLLAVDDTPKIADFGLAKKLDEQGITLNSAAIGTPSYMAPEQASGKFKEAGPAADIYALGAILYELLTGRPPFQGANGWEVVEQVKSKEPVSPRRLQPRVPRDLETICLKCLQKVPAKRYDSAEALADDLRRYLNGETIVARRTPVWERSVKWARRRPTRASLMGVAVLLLLLAGAASLLYWVKYTVKVEYYASLTKRWDAFEGVAPVTEAEARHRTLTYKVYRRGSAGLVDKVELVNGHGEFAPRVGTNTFIDGWTGQLDLKTQRECCYEFKRDQQGRVIAEIASDRNGEIIWILQYTPNKDLAYYSDKNGWPSAHAPSGAAYVEFVRNEEGLVVEARYRNNDREPRPDRDGIFGARWEYDQRGLPVRQTFLNHKGEPTLNKFNFAEIRTAYNDLGEPTEIKFFGRQGELVIHKDGYAGLTSDYDNHGRTNQLMFVGLNDKPTLSKNGVAKATFVYDDHGNIIRLALFDPNGKPTLHKDGYAAIDRKYDDRGHLIEESYIGLDGRPILTKGGTAKITNEYDERGNHVRQRFFDTDGKLTLHKDGFAEITCDLDDHGKIIRKRYFDTDRNPTLHKNGYAEVDWKYNDHGRLIEETYFGTDGQAILNKDGYAKATSEYDRRNNLSEVAYFDDRGQRALHKDGNWKLIMKYDDKTGDQTETVYIGLDGQPTFMKDGHAKVAWTYDAVGNKIEEAYFDPDGRPTLVKDGYAKIKMQYDDLGHNVARACFDVHDKPTSLKQGHWKIAWKYDDNGNQTEEAYFGLDGRPTLVNGAAKIKMQYDSQGNKTEKAHFGLEGQPVRHPQDGFWKIVWQYDNRGNQIEESYFGPEGKPMLVHGAAKTKMQYDSQGNRTEMTRFDLDDKPARHLKEDRSKTVWKCDNRGNPIEEAYFDRDGKPRLVDGIAKFKSEYDSQGNQVGLACFGLDEKPVPRPKQGDWKTVWKCDNRGNKIEESYLDPDGKPMLVMDVAKFKTRYDNLGNPLESTLHDLQDKPVLGVFGIAKITWRYDSRGNKIEQATFDQKGQPTLARFGTVNPIARFVYRYDDHGNKTEASWYGVDGKLTLAGDAAKWKAKYDPRGNLLEQTWFGPDDRPKKNYSGYATIKCRYDDVRGNRLEEAYYGPDGKPTLKEVEIDGDSTTFRKAGYAKVQWTYDDMNQENGATYFDVQGNPLKTQVCITAVSPNSLAKTIGLKENDILVNYGGQEIRTTYTFVSIKRSERPGDKPKDLTVLRDGKPRTFRSTPPGLLGIELRNQVVPGKNELTSDSTKKP